MIMLKDLLYMFFSDSVDFLELQAGGYDQNMIIDYLLLSSKACICQYETLYDHRLQFFVMVL